MSRRPRLGIVTGLAAEARIARGFEGIVEVAGASDESTSVLAVSLIDRGIDGLVSFGVAGGLNPTLKPGTVVIAGAILAPDGARYETDPAWSGRLEAAMPASVVRSTGAIAGSEIPLADVAAKTALHQKTGAVAVDMESHVIAMLAARHRVPFIAVRAIADPAARGLPRAALAGMDGRIPPVLAALIRRPRDLVPLIGLAAEYRSALAGLRSVTLRGGPLLALL